MAEMKVELADLRGWSRQVERNSETIAMMGNEAPTTIADGDFGKVLELITGDYEQLLPTFHQILPEDGGRLEATAQALRGIARDFTRTDAEVAEMFGGAVEVTDDHDASAFEDAQPAILSCPSVSARDLPHVSFGFPFDQACDLLSSIGFPDPREYVTQWIVGDVGKAERQAAYWDMYGQAMGAVTSNLQAGQSAIDLTWTGESATSSSSALTAWSSALSDQGSAMSDMAGHLRDMVQQALDMAQMVVDTVKFFISTVAAGWTNAYIPIYGQIKLVEKVKDAWHLINNARKVIMVFWSFLKVMKDAIVGVVHSFQATDLPSAPAVPA